MNQYEYLYESYTQYELSQFAGGQHAKIGLTMRINDIVSYGWELVGYPQQSGNIYGMTFRRPKAETE